MSRRLAAGGEQLDQQQRRLRARHGQIDQQAPLGARRLHVQAGVAADHRVAVVHAQRRQVDAIDTVGHGDAVGQAAAVQENDAKALAQRTREREAARQVADAERVLAVEEKRLSGAGAPEVTESPLGG
jgi:uncharacterized protein (DUF3084 family)